MYLGIDLGTSSLKAILADESGKILTSSSCSYPIYISNGNWSEQNPEDWYIALLSVLKKLSENYSLEQVKGVSFSGQMHGMVALDKDGGVIRNALLWNDGRTVAEVEYLNKVVGQKNLIDWTGNVALTGFTAPKILWMKNNELDNYNNTCMYLLPKDFLAYKMTGLFCSDVSDSSGTLYFDVKNRKWSKPMLDVLGIDESKLPKVFESTQIIGNISAQFAKESGMSVNTNVVIGGGDQAVGAVGTGSVGDCDVSISLGTSGVVFASTENYYKDENASLHNFCHANGKYHLMGVTLSAAESMKWWISDVLKRKDYDDLIDLTADLPIDDLLFLPYLMGERSPINDPYAKGQFYGLTLSHKQEQITKAIIEGVNFSLKDCMSVMIDLGIKPTKARCIGGGAKSKVFLQVLADILNVEVYTVNTLEGAGYGAVILAMVGCGRYQSVETACAELISVADRFIPNIERNAQYEKKFIAYRALYQRNKGN